MTAVADLFVAFSMLPDDYYDLRSE
ncbi:hypothetical protein [Mycobacterium leprae]|nr:hypothetical protein [Mycobacterium leprae]